MVRKLAFDNVTKLNEKKPRPVSNSHIRIREMREAEPLVTFDRIKEEKQPVMMFKDDSPEVLKAPPMPINYRNIPSLAKERSIDLKRSFETTQEAPVRHEPHRNRSIEHRRSVERSDDMLNGFYQLTSDSNNPSIAKRSSAIKTYLNATHGTHYSRKS